MVSMISGLVVLAVTGVIFWALLPRGGRVHRLVGTEWEPYVSVALCTGIALAFTLSLSGALSLVGNP